MDPACRPELSLKTYKNEISGLPYSSSVGQAWVSDSAELVVPGSSPDRGRDLFNHKCGSVVLSISLSSTHRPDITEILLKRT